MIRKLLSERLASVDLKECSNTNEILNNTITAEEVALAVKSLKNIKACGSDGITNEMLKITTIMFLLSFLLERKFYKTNFQEWMF